MRVSSQTACGNINEYILSEGQFVSIYLKDNMQTGTYRWEVTHIEFFLLFFK